MTATGSTAHALPAAAGDAAAAAPDFSVVAARYRRELIAHCYRMTGSFTEAEDLVQETYLRAWRSYAGFEGRASVRTWLYRIATNRCLTTRSRAAAAPAPALSLPPPLPPPPNAPDVEVAAGQRPTFSDAQVLAAVEETLDTGGLGRLRRKVAAASLTVLIRTALAHLPPRQDPDALTVPDHL